MDISTDTHRRAEIVLRDAVCVSFTLHSKVGLSMYLLAILFMRVDLPALGGPRMAMWMPSLIFSPTPPSSNASSVIDIRETYFNSKSFSREP